MPHATLSDLGLPAPPLIVGHRGASAMAAENTLRSFGLAVQAGADMIELDLYLTSDDVLVASHDCDLRRTAGLDLRIEETPWDELRQVDVSKVYGDQPATMPRLEDILA